jgi:hypothetical protein
MLNDIIRKEMGRKYKMQWVEGRIIQYNGCIIPSLSREMAN